MALAQQKRYEFNEFGGICSLSTAGDTPPEMSPDTQNTMFFPGGVRSRDLFRTYLTDPEGSITYFHTYITPNGDKYRLFFFDTGAIKAEHPESTLTPIIGTSDGTFAAASRPLATTLFGKAFMALGDGSKGVEFPRQYSPTLGALFPVAPDGPGKAPELYTAVAYPKAAAAADTGFVMVKGDTGPPIIPGSVVNVVMCFKTKTGFLTAPSPPLPVCVNANGTYVFKFKNMALGPAYVTERWFFATPSTGGVEYFHIPGGGMQMKDNTSTDSAEFGYSDSVLQSGIPLSSVVGNPLPAVSGVSTYGDRLICWGGTNTLPNFLSSKTSALGIVIDNSSMANANTHVGTYFGCGYMQGPINWRFEGGVTTVGGIVTPNGWSTSVGIAALKGEATTSATANGHCWRFTGTAAGAVNSVLNSATVVVSAVDGVQGPFLTGIFYSYRIRVRRSSGATGNLRFTGVGGNWDINVATQVGTDWTIIEGGNALMNPAISMTTAPPNTEWVEIDWIQPFEQGYPYERSVVRVSNPQGDCEVFSDANLISVAPDDGQEIRNVFELRGNLYIVKERSIYYTKNTGDVASLWPIDVVSSSVGTSSIYGVALGDGFAIIAGGAGVYQFNGGRPVKMSSEIDDLWTAEASGSDQWVAIDQRNQFFLAKSGNYIFHCNYWMGMDSGINAGGKGRKWSRWKSYGRATEVSALDPVQPTFGGVTVRDNGSLSILATGTSLSSNKVVNTGSSTFDGTATFPPAALANQWYALDGSAVPTGIAAGVADPFGGTTAWSWTESAGAKVRGIYVGNAGGATSSFAGIYLKASVTTIVTLSVRYYSTTSAASSYTGGQVALVTVGTDWTFIGESDIQSGVQYTGRRVLAISYTGGITMSACAPSVQGEVAYGVAFSGYNHGYVPNTSGSAVSGVKSGLVKVLTPATAVTGNSGAQLGYDSDAYVPSFYAGPPGGNGTDRSTFTMLIARIWGNGTLEFLTYKPYPYYGTAQRVTSALPGDPSESMELSIADTAHDGQALNASFLSWRVGTGKENVQPMGYWQMSKAAILFTDSLTPLRLVP